MTIEKASETAIHEFIAQHPDWHLDAGRLCRQLRFTDFSEAFAFMTRVALAAERQNHHPEWLNVYNRVDVRLSTHEAAGITSRDFTLAETIDGLVVGQST